jgi:ankyrin repeat protein
MTSMRTIKGRLASVVVGLLLVTTVAWSAPADARLSLAAMEGDIEAVRTLIDQGVDVNAPQGDGTSALHWAASRNDLEMTQLLLEAGADVGARTRLGDMTPLFMAARSGNASIIEALAEANADATSASTIGTTALMLAAGAGSPDAVRALLNAGASVNAKDLNQGQTALMFAAASGREDVIRVLAENGAELDVASLVPTRRKPAARAAGNTAAPRRGRGGPPKPLALGGLTAMHFAAREGHLDAVRALVEAGADVNVSTASDAMSTLTLAIVNGRLEMAKYLLEQGADPNPPSTEGATALFATVDIKWAPRGWYPSPRVDNEEVDYLELMQLLVDHGADVDARMKGRMWMRIVGPGGGSAFDGDTAFLRAAQANDVDAMRFLLSQGANPSITTAMGVNALLLAAGWGDQPSEGRHVAPEARLAAVRFLVEEAGLGVNSTDKDGFTPLHGAALVGDRDVIMYFVARGGDVATRANVSASAYSLNGNAAKPGTGETVADVANGPLEKTLVFPEVIDLLMALGSEFSDNCRAALCINKPRP